ncbi:hypothetical protein [Noviherbaspirillum galbum]|uniref:Uncharacterized protein n=1 Tax=Noviherbaspirillum galbum TaxID=2709383 RepID=A0A6B3SPD0_9BURK|nr:hypothetical protein [Noviherbaspirillum galbum]NEX62491.1 hypothetical protein [Noviherbaspirillum galbum]
MWKIFAAFIVFALAALFVIMKGGEKVDMQGEAGHGTSSSHEASAPATPASPATAPTAPAAPAASAPESSTPPASSAPAASK